MSKFNREEGLYLKKKYEDAIKIDEEMMELQPEDMFWVNDYDFNSGILNRINKQLKECSE